MKVYCSNCGDFTELKRDPDYLDRLLLEALSGWTFNTEQGWRCPVHSKSKEARG